MKKIRLFYEWDFHFLMKTFRIMRITVFLLLASILQTFANDAYSQKTRLSLNFSKTKLVDAMDEIEELSEFYFLFNEKLIDTDREVSMSVENQKIDKILNKLFSETDVIYTITDRKIILAPSFLSDNQQQKTIAGTVTDESGQALPGVTVVIKGATKGTVTNADGNYSISNIPEDAILVFSFVGMRAQEVPVAGKVQINIVLETETIGLDEVIAIGYGTQSRAKITTSVSKLDNEVLENIPYMNVGNALIGSIAGLRVQSISGQPGEGPRIILRGGNSINDPNGAVPLYIVDGIIRENLDDIPSADIESLQVLKDAAATAIYGSRASNGVVLVTTKSGKAGTLRVTYSYDKSFADEGNRLLQYTNAEEYITAGRTSIATILNKEPDILGRLNLASGFGTGNDLTNNTMFSTQYLSDTNRHKLNEGWKSMPDPLDPSKTIIFSDNDYQDLGTRIASSNNHHLSVSGGTDKAVVNFGLGYMDGEGTRWATDYKRLTFNLSGSLQVNEKLKVSGRVMYSDVIDHDRTHGNSRIFYRGPALPSTSKLYFEDGTMNPGPAYKNGNALYYQTGPYAPVFKNTSDRLSMSLSADWKILPGLSFQPQVSLSESESQNHYFQPAYFSKFNKWNSTRETEYNYRRNKYYQADAVLTYIKSFADHNIEAKIGYAYYEKRYDRIDAVGYGASSDLVSTLNAAAVPYEVWGEESQFVTEGLFSRINYDYYGKYLVSLTARYDGASNLGANSRYGFFPGISAGWNLHQEDFWKEKLSDVSLKLRVSYGENGNIAGLGDFQAQGSYSVGDKYMGNAAVVPGAIPNQNLAWEESKTFDIGMDLGLFNNRVTILFDYYDKTTDNLLTNVSLPPSSGFSSVLTNFGSLSNKGFELELNARVLPDKSPVKWDMGFSIAKVKTRILKLPENGVENNRQGGVYVWDPAIGDYAWLGGLQEGGRIGDMFTQKQIGIYATDAEAANAPADMSIPNADKTKYGGDVNFADLDGNDVIDGQDMAYVGNPYPTVNGGFTNSLAYKNFSLIVRTDFTLGHTIYNYPKQFADGQLHGDLMPSRDFWEKSWKEQGDITDTPRYIFHDKQRNVWKNSTYWEKADFLALREVTLGYNLPTSVLNKIKLSNVRFNLTGSNLHYFTKYRGLNPEGTIKDSGKSGGDFPNPRTITFGVNITL